VTDISHGKKLRIPHLSVSLPGEANDWFWGPVNESDLAPLHNTGYDNISHRLICALSERWHKDTSSFHLPIGEMSVRLDDVACLLHIPITGRLIEEEELDHDEGIELLHDELYFT